MKVFRVSEVAATEAVEGSVAARLRSLHARPPVAEVAIDIIELDGHGRIAEHRGRRDQLCVLINGGGWVSGGADRSAIGVGHAVLWQAGEPRSIVAGAEGLTLVSLRAAGLTAPAGHLPE